MADSRPVEDVGTGWQDRFVGFLIRRHRVLLLLSVILTIVAWPISRQLKFDQTIESMYAPHNPYLQAFVRSKQAFGGDEFVIVAYPEEHLFEDDITLSKEAGERLVRLGGKIAELPGIEPGSVQHMVTAMRSPYGRSRIREFVEGILVSNDGQTVAVMARLKPIDQLTAADPSPPDHADAEAEPLDGDAAVLDDDGEVPGGEGVEVEALAVEAPAIPVDDVNEFRAETFRAIRQIAAEHNPPAVVLGEPVQVHDMFRYVEEDGFTLGLWSTLLLMAMLFILFRSVRWMVMPLAIVCATLVWTKAIFVLSGQQLSMVSSILDSLVAIIVIATATHVILRYRELAPHHDRERALFLALRQLVVPVFWVTITTTAGFAALMTCSITPVASFGYMMSVATVMLMVAGIGAMPGIILLGRTTPVPAVSALEAPLGRSLSKITDSVDRRPILVWSVMGLVALACLPGLFHLRIESDFSKNFRQHSPIVQALNFFEDHLGGAGMWEVNFPAPNPLTEEYLAKVEALAADLREIEARTTPDRVTKVVAVTDGLSLVPEKMLIARVALPTRLMLLNRIQPDYLKSLYNGDIGRMRIVLRAMEQQPSEVKLKLIDDVEQAARQYFPEAEATGLYVLLAHLVESLMDDQVVSSVLAMVSMVVLMTFAFRNVWLSLSLLAPSVFPLVVVLGVMGIFDMKINVGSAMIAAVSMGLTIDSGILYLFEYRNARARGLSFSEALTDTHQGVGLAVLLSNVALIIGFMVLTLSHFIPLIYFGLLVNVTMIGGLAGNLVLLPLLLRIFDRSPVLPGAPPPPPANGPSDSDSPLTQPNPQTAAPT